jgi:hypothetical protein
VATYHPFGELFRDWTVALARSGWSGNALPATFGTLGGRFLCGPRFESLSLGEGHARTSLAGTSAVYFLMHSATTQATRVVVQGEDTAQLQITLIRLPAEMLRLELRREFVNENVRLTLTAHDADVRLDGAAWERLVPKDNEARDTSVSTSAPLETCGSWFGSLDLKAGETRSVVIDRPGSIGKSDAWYVKVSGTDEQGRHVGAYAVIDGD